MLFSIIIPCYNIENYISQALNSLLRQTISNWECICVNDGSTDGTAEILADYAVRDKRIHIYSQSNRGVSAARNLGLEKLSGDWLLFLDGDDMLHPQTLELCQNAIISSGTSLPDGIVFKGISDINPRFEKAYANNEIVFTTINCSAYLPYNLLLSGFFLCAYRVVTHNIPRFKNYVATEDRLFWMTWLCSANNIVSLDAELYAYRLRPGSATKSPETIRKVTDAFNASMEIARELEKSRKQIDRIYLRRLNTFLFETMAYHIFVELKAIANVVELQQHWKTSIKEIVNSRCVFHWYRFWFAVCRGKLFGLAIIIFLTTYKMKLLRNNLMAKIK